MLTQTTLLQNIEWDLGYKFTDLEISPEEIMSIIKLRTLPDFSKYFPYQERLRINIDTDKVPGYSNRFYLRTDHEILNINRIVGNSNRNSLNDIVVGTPSPLMSTAGGASLYEMDAYATMTGFTNVQTYQYYHPDMIEFSPNSSLGSYYIVVCNVVHDESLLTIPANMQDYFRQLAVCDVKSSLYLIRNRIANLQSSLGSIELFIDDLSTARDERRELMEKFAASSIKSARRKKLIIR